jgi:L-lactate dehydrogenase (cytochrome)
MGSVGSALTIDDLKQMARRRVPRMFFEYADSGSWTEQTYRDNETDFARVNFRQRVAVNLENRSLATTMLGQPVNMPLAFAPAATCGMQIADGEIKAARAAEKFGIPFSLSTMSVCSIEDVAENTSKPFWFQLYMMKDRAFMGRLIDRAKAANARP